MFSSLSHKQLKKKREGIFAACITGNKMQMCKIRLEAGVTTRHSHFQEQMGYILSGEVEITIGDEKKICKAGDAYYIPSNILHGFRALSVEVEYIEIFSPPKDDN